MVIAHVKWFVEVGNEVAPFSLREPSVGLWALIVVGLIVLATVLNKFIKGPSKKWMNWVNSTRSKWVYVFQVMLAASLIYAAVNQVILVPHYEASTLAIPIVELLAALFLLINRWVWMGAGLLLVTYLASAISYGPEEVADYINVLGIVAFLFLEKPINKNSLKWKDRSLDVLRISTGAALIILAFSEKLFAPSSAMTLLSQYDLNFMSVIGINYSDRLFILSAGSMELVFGSIMMLGVITRINTFMLASFLVSSNVYFFLQGNYSEGWMELMGHLPIIGTALLLVLYGKSFKVDNQKGPDSR